MNQLTNGPPAVASEVYTASHGRSQFIGQALVGQLLSAYNTFPADVQTQLGLTPAMKTLLQQAQVRGIHMLAIFNSTPAPATYAAAANGWTNLSAAQKASFTAQTGLGETEYDDMLRMK